MDEEQTSISVNDLVLLLLMAEFAITYGGGKNVVVLPDTVNRTKRHLITNHNEATRKAFDYWQERL